MLPLILASSSSSRRHLLERLAIPFESVSPDVDESVQTNESAEQLVKRLSMEKAGAVAKDHTHAIIIGADQVAACDEHYLGKPLTHDNAVHQLHQVSGKVVVFHSGLCVLNTDTNEHQVDDITTVVEFRTLTAAEIEYYLTKEPAYHCAGSFKSEALGISLCHRMTSDDPTALVGLPLIRLTQMLRATGHYFN